MNIRNYLFLAPRIQVKAALQTLLGNDNFRMQFVHADDGIALLFEEALHQREPLNMAEAVKKIEAVDFGYRKVSLEKHNGSEKYGTMYKIWIHASLKTINEKLEQYLGKRTQINDSILQAKAALSILLDNGSFKFIIRENYNPHQTYHSVALLFDAAPTDDVYGSPARKYEQLLQTVGFDHVDLNTYEKGYTISIGESCKAIVEKTNRYIKKTSNTPFETIIDLLALDATVAPQLQVRLLLQAVLDDDLFPIYFDKRSDKFCHLAFHPTISTPQYEPFLYGYVCGAYVEKLRKAGLRDVKLEQAGNSSSIWISASCQTIIETLKRYLHHHPAKPANPVEPKQATLCSPKISVKEAVFSVAPKIKAEKPAKVVNDTQSLAILDLEVAANRLQKSMTALKAAASLFNRHQVRFNEPAVKTSTATKKPR